MSLDYLDNYRDPARVNRLIHRIEAAANGLKQPIRLMEVCGGHTMAIHRFGIPSILPDCIELLSGPGCPVCVTPPSYIDAAIRWGEEHGGTIATFGDLYRVPGSKMTLEEASDRGLDVKVVYSPFDALNIAAGGSAGEVLFLGVGFETTAPAVAATLEMARDLPGVPFRVMSAHKTMPHALRALVRDGEAAIDGFLLPGHVSTITGSRPYGFLAEDHHISCCISGFEPVDILRAILSLTGQCAAGTPRVDNTYPRAVRRDGNLKAQEMMKRVFETVSSRWRGIGCIEGSGLDLQAQWDVFRVPPPAPEDGPAEEGLCRCGEVLRGVLKPHECGMFGRACTPEHPVGPCMVSSEGSCAALYKYQGTRQGET